MFVSAAALHDPEERPALLRPLPKNKLLRDDVTRLLETYELLRKQGSAIRADLVKAARKEPMVRRFREVPGFGWIRAMTFFVYLDTPHRFRNKSALWRYCGIGLRRQHSGAGKVQIKLCRQGHRRLKCVVQGAALTAIRKGHNPFGQTYPVVEGGRNASATARRNVARSLSATLWGMWKHNTAYDPARVPTVVART